MSEKPRVNKELKDCFNEDGTNLPPHSFIVFLEIIKQRGIFQFSLNK